MCKAALRPASASSAETQENLENAELRRFEEKQIGCWVFEGLHSVRSDDSKFQGGFFPPFFLGVFNILNAAFSGFLFAELAETGLSVRMPITIVGDAKMPHNPSALPHKHK